MEDGVTARNIKEGTWWLVTVKNAQSNGFICHA